MYTDADKHLKDFNALNQYQQEDEDIWGEELEPDINEEADEEEILLISDDFVISEEDYINKKSKEKSNAFVKLENDPRITKIGRTPIRRNLFCSHSGLSFTVTPFTVTPA